MKFYQFAYGFSGLNAPRGKEVHEMCAFPSIIIMFSTFSAILKY